MLERQRHQLLLEILDEQQFASVADLTTQLNSSEATIRRDLIKLHREGRLEKIRGGAQRLKNAAVASGKTHITGSAFLVNKDKAAAAKRAIARHAVSMCEENELIIVNGGSSTYMMGEFLVQRDVGVLTNSYYLAQYLCDNGQNQVTVPSGEIYRKQGIILSPFENDSIQNYRSKLMFTGTAGIGEFGVMETDSLLVRAEQKLRKQAEKLVVLADSSKLGHKSNFILYPIHEVDVLITDEMADPAIVEKIQSHGVEVILVAIEPLEAAV
ncbi:DeoR/GlpR family DNA-binding transcription regulator [Simiduia agarivorans]|uniref:DeoR family transcriptional regulator n=1 Tax=Simiduia agarivorans (strain DSM 21679 / JCM 13881 / BCRC 17597 / SA1) TaxID=1117647 RepID=K4KQR2_SIMAS|nr:DeoR/GlpR family DNA-binding transcription regulator [Simiduia agarivorans]AFV00464.1 DeoR family transcriptional regulator [Simiduia agarivorans SA1 = DSM 21679]